MQSTSERRKQFNLIARQFIDFHFSKKYCSHLDGAILRYSGSEITFAVCFNVALSYRARQQFLHKFSAWTNRRRFYNSSGIIFFEKRASGTKTDERKIFKRRLRYAAVNYWVIDGFVCLLVFAMTFTFHQLARLGGKWVKMREQIPQRRIFISSLLLRFSSALVITSSLS